MCFRARVRIVSMSCVDMCAICLRRLFCWQSVRVLITVVWWSIFFPTNRIPPNMMTTALLHSKKFHFIGLDREAHQRALCLILPTCPTNNFWLLPLIEISPGQQSAVGIFTTVEATARDRQTVVSLLFIVFWCQDKSSPVLWIVHTGSFLVCWHEKYSFP